MIHQGEFLETLALEDIKLGCKYLRTDTNIEKLVASIKQVGLINPLIVNNDNELIAGGRRYMALQELGWKEAPVSRVDKNELEQELISIDENLMRKDLNGIELENCLARGQEIYEQLNPTDTLPEFSSPEEIEKIKEEEKQEIEAPKDILVKNFVKATAQKTGMSESSIRMAIRRNRKTSDKIKDARQNGELGATQTNELIQLSEDEQDKILPYIKKKAVKEVRDLVQKIKQDGIASAIEYQTNIIPADPEYDNLYRMGKRVNRLLSKVLKDSSLQMGSQEEQITNELELLKENLVSFFDNNEAYDYGMANDQNNVPEGLLGQDNDIYGDQHAH